jgi:hypothetical protein
MFEKDQRSLCQALTAMERQSREATRFDQIAAREKFKEYLGQDRRFDPFDKDALVRRVQECRSNGAVLELDDPRLQGKEARPLEKSRW